MMEPALHPVLQETVDLTAERVFEVLSACGMAHALPLSFAGVFNVRTPSVLQKHPGADRSSLPGAHGH
jgi:hypothetical protein